MPRSDTQNEQMRAESRAKIIETARKLFAEQGYNGCNVSTIAKQAGMSQGNIYWYFSSKEDILKAILIDGYETLGTMMAEAVERPGPAIDKLTYVLQQFIVLSKEHGGDQFLAIVVTLIGQGGVGLLSKFGADAAELGAAYHRSISAIIEQGQSEGTFPPEINANLLTTFFFAFLNGLMMMYPKEWKDIPEALIHQAMLRLMGNTHK